MLEKLEKMALRWIYIIYLAGGTLACFNIIFMWKQLDLSPHSTCDCGGEIANGRGTGPLRTSGVSRKSTIHNLSVIVPFRDRYDEMMEFVPHIHSFLQRQEVSHQIWIINQVDEHRFGY